VAEDWYRSLNTHLSLATMPLLFVYGTLKRGHCLHHYLEKSPCLGAAKTVGGYALYRIEWYPAMVPEHDAGGVSGEVFEVSTSLLAILDEVENVPDLYQRIEIEITELEGQQMQQRCLTYLYQQPVVGRARLTDGSW
jgi:gamma-glutamylcyclotransferase (GGCT)/AIG2-like uncharacterized protein YtfP